MTRARCVGERALVHLGRDGHGRVGERAHRRYAEYHADFTRAANAEALTSSGLSSAEASATLEAMAELGAVSR